MLNGPHTASVCATSERRCEALDDMSNVHVRGSTLSCLWALAEALATGQRLRDERVYHVEIVNPPPGAERMNFSISESVIEVTFPSAGSVTLYEDHPPMAAVMAM
jgi:hypothetical protein